jgi:hypothetical protein
MSALIAVIVAGDTAKVTLPPTTAFSPRAATAGVTRSGTVSALSRSVNDLRVRIAGRIARNPLLHGTPRSSTSTICVEPSFHRHPGRSNGTKPNLTASSFVELATDRMVTRRVRFPLKFELKFSVIFAWMRYVAPGASDGVRYVPATTAEVMLVVPRAYVTTHALRAPVALTVNLSAAEPSFWIEMSKVRSEGPVDPLLTQTADWCAPVAL